MSVRSQGPEVGKYTPKYDSVLKKSIATHFASNTFKEASFNSVKKHKVHGKGRI